MQYSNEETVLLQIDANYSKVFVPKRLKWDEITIPDEFKIDIPQIPRNLERTEISEIIEESDGTILFRFNSLKEGRNQLPLPSLSSRSFTEPEPNRHFFTDNASASYNHPLKVHHKTPIPEMTTEQPYSALYSPTSTQMEGISNKF